LRAAPCDCGSLVKLKLSSGIVVFPSVTRPAAAWRCAKVLDSVDIAPPNHWCTPEIGVPASSMTLSFTKNGTPVNGPAGNVAATWARARSKKVCANALSTGVRRSTCSIALVSISSAETSRRATSAARAVASSVKYSAINRAERVCGPC
jgi:hypothetical protein